MAVLLWLGSVVMSPYVSMKAAGMQSPSLAPARPPSPSPHRAVLDGFCVSCHNARLRTAGLQLDTADVDHPQGNAAVWEKVLHKLRTREMPPSGAPHPDNVTYDSLANYLENALDQAAETRPNPGRPAVYRLN